MSKQNIFKTQSTTSKKTINSLSVSENTYNETFAEFVEKEAFNSQKNESEELLDENYSKIFDACIHEIFIFVMKSVSGVKDGKSKVRQDNAMKIMKQIVGSQNKLIMKLADPKLNVNGRVGALFSNLLRTN